MSCLYLKHRPVYFSRHDVTEIGFRFALQVNLLSWAQSIELVSVSEDRAQVSRFYLKTETESSFRNVVFWKINRTMFLDKDKMMGNVQKYNIYIITFNL
jgi:hypothetical protein